MYAVGDAYRLHTECIQAYKKRKREDSSSYFFFILSVFLSSTARFSGNHFSLLTSSSIPRRTMNKTPLPVFADNRLFGLFTARLTGCPPSSRPILAPRSSHTPVGVYAFRPFRRLRCLGGRSKTCMHCMHQKNDYALYVRTQLRKRLHTMHTETRIGVSVGLRGCKCMQLGMHTKCIQNAYKHKRVKREEFFLLLLLYCLRSSIFYCPRLRAFTNLIALIVRSFRPAGRMRVPRDAYRHLQTV